MNRSIMLGLWLLSLMVLGACDQFPSKPPYQKEIVVFGFLWGNKPMTDERAIMISYTQPIDQIYDVDEAVISNARVIITELGSGNRYVLRDAKRPGFYFNDSLIAIPRKTYRLEVDVGDRIVIGETTVPYELDIRTSLSSNGIDSVFYDNLSIEKPIYVSCEDGGQIIIIDVYCHESWQNAEYINPFWGKTKPSDAAEYGGQDGNSEPRHIIASAKYRDLFSSNFPGHYVIDWYASMIGFYGAYTIQVLAIDDNYYRFLNRKEYPELQSGLKGGIGVFGSVCGETFRLYIMKR